MKKIYLVATLMVSAQLFHAQCFQDRHSTVAEDAWISCEKTSNPNSDRENSHWIMYDLGHIYALHQSQFWNVNAPDRTNEGISEAVVDYSIDGIEWNEWGTFNLGQADASGFYEGEEGPDFNGLKAQFILITVLNTHGGECAGLSEIKIETTGVTTSTEEKELVNGLQINISPNPADQNTTIQINSSKAYSTQLQVIDMAGRIIFQNPISITKGDFKYELETSELSEGQYLINILNGPKPLIGSLSVIHLN